MRCCFWSYGSNIASYRPNPLMVLARYLPHYHVPRSSVGSLYVDDGVSIVQEKSTSMKMEFVSDKLCVNGSFAYKVGVKVTSVAFLGVENRPMAVTVHPGNEDMPFTYDGTSKVLCVQINMSLTEL